MQKLKLLPTLKEKKRYVVYEVITEKSLDKDISLQIFEKANAFLGLFDGAKAGLQNLVYDKKKQKGIIRVTNNYVDKLKSVLMMITNIEGQNIMIKSVYVSGIINKAKRVI